MNESTKRIMLPLLLATMYCAPVSAHEPQQHRTEKADSTRFITSRDAAELVLPSEEDAFFFAVLGDRTEGTDAGLPILKEAVSEINLLEPDFVMTVGDMVQGYNQTDGWMKQMRDYKRIMGELLCPWFPVAGNHDIYWRGEDKPAGEHEASYEMHFGPLWYAFEHKGSWFIVLYSDEGDPDTGVKDFGRPSAQRMSPEQFAWLRDTLQKTADAKHVFVFLHHPRWTGAGYGQDWTRVHNLLAEAGNVRAVFAGHIHRMRYDGPHDGIEYVTLATTGGSQSHAVPQAGYLDHFHIVTVRDEQIAMAAIPVGDVMDVRAITALVSSETRALSRLSPQFENRLALGADGAASGVLEFTLTNPVSRPIDVTVTPDSADSRWVFAPDHEHAMIGPGESRSFTLHGHRQADALDDTFRLPNLLISMDYLAPTMRFSIPSSKVSIPLSVDLPAAAVAAGGDRALDAAGNEGWVEVASSDIPLADGPMTLECWARADSFASRTGLVAKTENSEYGFFVNGGVPAFYLFLGDQYVEVAGEDARLAPGRWFHIAGVFDGSETRLYVDGQLIQSVERNGRRRVNGFPLIIGADVGGSGQPVSFFDGQIDEVRLSNTARYAGDQFAPANRHNSDEATLLLLRLDGAIGPWTPDASGNGAHGVVRGPVTFTKSKR